MVHILVRHKLEDYKKWREGFDAHADARKAGGEVNCRVFKKSEKDDEVVILCEWDSMENAKNFIQNPDLKEKMKESGVVDEPTIVFLEET